MVVNGDVWHEGGYGGNFVIAKVGLGFYGQNSINDLLYEHLRKREGHKIRVTIEDLGPSEDWRQRTGRRGTNEDHRSDRRPCI